MYKGSTRIYFLKKGETNIARIYKGASLIAKFAESKTVSGTPPITLSGALARPISHLTISGNTKRTVEIDGTEYVIPDGYTLLDNSGSTATAYYCKRQSDSATGTINLVTDVFTASSFTAGNELPTPEVPLGVVAVGDKTENLLNGSATPKRVSYDATTGTITNTVVDTIELRLRLYNGSASPNSLPQSLGVHTYTFTAYGNYTEIRHNGSAVNLGITWERLLTPGEEYTLSYNVVSDDTKTVGGFVISGLMIVEGSTAPSSYEPYGCKLPITLNSVESAMYLPCELSKVGTYADIVNAISGVMTKNVGMKELDGTESWAAYARLSNCYYIGIADSKASTGINILCTHYQGKSQGADKGVYIGATNIGSVQCGAFYFTDADFADVSEWTAFLAAQYAAGTPVVVYYPLASSTTENITAVSLSTVQGSNVIDIETSVKPSSASVTYIGI